MKNCHKYLILLLMIVLPVSLKAIDASRYIFSHLSIDDGAPHNYIEDMMRDHRGFLWLSTGGNGVSRYDGYEFMQFNTTSPVQLKNNFVEKMCEDRFGRIWMVGICGLDILDTERLQLVTPDMMGPLFKKLNICRASFIYASKAGNIWLVADGILYKITFAQNGMVEKILPICQVTLSGRFIGFAEIGGWLWFNNKGSVGRIPEHTMTRQNPQPFSASVQLPPSTNVMAIHEWRNEVWLGTDNGLYRYSPESDAMKAYHSEAAAPYSLSQDYVTAITSTHDGVLAVATLKGLNLYQPLADNFLRIQQNVTSFRENNYSLNNNFINCLLADGQVLWIGTEVGGINKMTSSRLLLKKHLGDNIINSVCLDTDGTLWVGTVEDGLKVMYRGTTEFITYSRLTGSGLTHNSISALTADDRDRIWIGTWGGGFGYMTRSKNSPKQFHFVETKGSGQCNFVGTALYDRLNGLLWLGTTYSVFVYNPITNTISDPFNGKFAGQITGSLGGCIDGKDLWMGTTVGLFRIDLEAYRLGRMEYELYDYKLDRPEQKVIERVTSVIPSKNGGIWVGTNGNGFYKGMSLKGKYVFRNYSMDEGLVDNSVKGLWEDNAGHLWATTNNGLSCFAMRENQFRNFTIRDGLPTNQFYWNGTSGVGNILLAGSTQGLVEISLAGQTTPATKIPLVFTHLRSFDTELLPDDGVLSIHERDKSLSIDFAALDYNHSVLAGYRYRLKGFDDKWVELPYGKHTATYTNLSPGNYEFELQYSPNGRDWDTSKGLIIEVEPYFYKTAWFVVIVLVLLVFVVYRFIRWRFSELRHQQTLLYRLVDERTRELQDQKVLLSAQKEELSKQNELLVEQNRRNTEQKNQILEMSRKLEEATIDKLAFFTNITHEFRTPLTLIVGPIQRALKLSYNPQVIEQLHFVEKNSKYLLSLINQLMDFRKVEEGQTKIMCHPGNFERFINEMVPPFMAFCEKRDIEFRTLTRLSNPYLLFDEDIMRKVLTNLISNAIKFTPLGGCVTLYVASVPAEGVNEQLYIGVYDTGKGIPESDLEHIFNRFYQSDNQSNISMSGQSGTGIGLYLCRRLIQLLGGRIEARNNRTVGATFRVCVPITRGEITEPLQTIEEDSIVGMPDNGRLSILIVEDNKDMRDYIRSILSEYYAVYEASQGEEALEILRSNRGIDFIISDLMMPVMDGVELSRRVREDFTLSHIPFMMLTAKTSDEARLESYRMGVDSYLLKPFDENLLLARIVNILEKRRMLQQRFSLSMDVSVLEIDENSGDKKFLDQVMQVVKEHYQDPKFEVVEFIELMGVSKSLLNKKMNSLTGQSAGQFIRNYRLNMARELLLRNKVTHSMNISEIAYEVGFNDPKYFTRCFTKQFNVTPSSLLDN